jgi:tRNA 2-thiouridine synthesizing protein A|tara:strand:- start:704 stop:1018 length:315 start_codon:yes stop_codon:yes gene_type:complete
MPNNRPRHLASGHIIVDRLKHPAYLLCMDTKTTHLDARGLLCPLPVLKARKRLQSITVGDTLTMIADDPAAVIDVPHYCAESGNELVSSDQNGDDQTYVIRKTN